MEPVPLTRRQALAILGGAGVLAADGAVLSPAASPGKRAAGGYAPDGTAGRAAAFPLQAVKLLDGPFRANQARNTDYLLFLDPERMLRSFRINYGQISPAAPCGGWEAPDSQIRGHTTGHLLSGLALTWASTGEAAVRDRGRYLVGELAALQARAQDAGYHAGYLSAFPEEYFGRLEAGQPIWSPYYMIHKYLAGLIDQYQLAGDDQALDVAVRLGDWIDWRAGRLPYAQMQMILENEYGGLPEALANLYAITGTERYLAAARRFCHAAVLGPLARGEDRLAGLQCNVTTPKITGCLRMWEETGEPAYRDIAVSFWDIVTKHHSYVTGGSGNFEHWHAPDVIAGQLSNDTCEGCVSYNMLKLTRLLYFHRPDRTDLLDFYERTLFNMMLGTQDPDSPHGFNCYYTGLSPGAFRQQPMNYFPRGDPDVYSTDYQDFTCDHATGLETQAKFADTIYSRDGGGVSVNLFIPSELTWAERGITLRQVTGFPDEAATTIEVTAGAAAMTLRVRLPSWIAGPPRVRLNGADIRDAGREGGWLRISRCWRRGDRLQVTLPMRLSVSPAPDQPSVQALMYGPVVLAGGYGGGPVAAMPHLDPAAVTMTARRPLTFLAQAGSRPVTLLPLARIHHQRYTVYWNTA